MRLNCKLSKYKQRILCATKGVKIIKISSMKKHRAINGGNQSLNWIRRPSHGLGQPNLQRFGGIGRDFRHRQTFGKDFGYQRCKDWSKEWNVKVWNTSVTLWSGFQQPKTWSASQGKMKCNLWLTFGQWFNNQRPRVGEEVLIHQTSTYLWLWVRQLKWKREA